MPLRLAAPLALVLVAALAAGCGDSSMEMQEIRTGTTSREAPAPESHGAPIGASARSCNASASGAESLRATGIPCEQARQVLRGWQRQPSCSLPGGASRGSCAIRSYRCQSARTDRGLAVSCARPGRSIAFLARP